MIIANNLFLQLGSKTILDDVSFIFAKNQKIGVVGCNGAGKSTLLNVISKRIPLDKGSISVEKGRKLAHLPQEVVLHSTKNVLQEAVAALEDLDRLRTRLEELEPLLASSTDAIEEYANIHERLIEVNPDKIEQDAMQMLQGLGFSKEAMEKPVDSLSVGWKMRLVLAKMMLEKPDFYLFDEPTNHLDIFAKDWFLEYLKNGKTGFLLVSHDRYFLDHACDYILELDQGIGTLYTGNYEAYEQLKQSRLELQESQYQAQQKKRQQQMEVVERFKAKASKAKMAQSMLKKIEKEELIERPDTKKRAASFHFPPPDRSGKVVITVQDVAKDFETTNIFQHVSFEINRGDKVALVASNGKGKSTLLNLIAGKYPLQQGSVNLGHNVTWAFFEQDQEKSLKRDKTILDEVTDSCNTSEARQRVRTFLGAFLFPGDDVKKKIQVLSGGEKNRVAMVKVLLRNANFLLLDEPTNHLDIASKQILLQALQQYEGTMLFVSHDRNFLDGLATKVLELTADGVTSYEGNYESYLYQKKHREDALAPKPSVAEKTQKKDVTYNEEKNSAVSGQDYESRKNLGKIERNIKKLEAEHAELQVKFEALAYGTKVFNDAQKQLAEITASLAKLHKEWETIMAGLK